jgi:hypothetical protein
LEQLNLALRKQPRSYSICAKPTAAQAAAATDDDVISQDTEDAAVMKKPKNRSRQRK